MWQLQLKQEKEKTGCGSHSSGYVTPRVNDSNKNSAFEAAISELNDNFADQCKLINVNYLACIYFNCIL